MKLTNVKNSQKRAARGSVLVESACGTAVFALVAVAIIIGSINLFTYILNYQKVQLAANAAAQVAGNGRFWLGTFRPNYNPTNARENAAAAANSVLAQIGLPNCTIEEFEPSIQGRSGTGYNGFIVSHVKISVPGLQFPYANALGFPAVFSINADGYSAESSFTPYAACTFGVRSADGSSRRRIQIPVIGFGNQLNGQAATNANPGGSGSAVAGGTYFAAEVDLVGATVTNDRLNIVDTNTQPNTFSALQFR